MIGSEQKKYDVWISKAAMAVASLVIASSLAKEPKPKPIRLRKKDVFNSSPRLYPRLINRRWYLSEYSFDTRKFTETHKILRAEETFDGDVEQNQIRSIAQDGDSFNLNVGGQTRHAKYLLCEKLSSSG